MVPAAVAMAAFPGANGRIAYWSYSEDSSHWWVYSSRPDGTRQRQLVRMAASLNFSADGRRIVYTRQSPPQADPQSARGGIRLGRANGRDRSWLLRGGFQPATGAWWDVEWAAFSPDGSQVAFNVTELTTERMEFNTYVLGVDGAGLRLVARGARLPTFSPDGKRIAYISISGAVETVAADGTDRRTLDNPPSVVARRIDFAPDGTRLMFLEWNSRRRDSQIVIVNAETGDRTRLPARITGDLADAVWSPDGRRIAFAREDSRRVFTIRPDGTGMRLAFTARVPKIVRLGWQPRP
jgi:dipeptidyl aminopeptidase/acylaminoacyl peptidase